MSPPPHSTPGPPGPPRTEKSPASSRPPRPPGLPGSRRYQKYLEVQKALLPGGTGPPGPASNETPESPAPPKPQAPSETLGHELAPGALAPQTLPDQEFGPQAVPPRWGTMIPLIGGSALGCERASGVRPLFHLSYGAFAANESHLLKAWPEVPMYRVDKDTFPSHLYPDIDFINSVCPCAGLSMLNTQKTGGSARGTGLQNEWLVKSAEFVLQEVRPKVLWGENAPGLFLALGAAMVPRLRALAARYGYSFSMVKTDTNLHGLPQHRMRTFYFFWRSTTAPLLRWVRKSSPDLLSFLASIPKSAKYQDLYVQEGSVTDRFKPYQYVLLREKLSHSQFARKMAIENNGTITVSKYLDKFGLLDDCISWMKLYFPNERWSLLGKGRTIVDYLEHCKMKLSKGLGYWDDSPKFMGNTFTAVITKNVVFAVHPKEDRFLNIRELMHLMGLPQDYKVENPVRNWNHICQNVPVDTAAAWAEQVITFCRGQLDESGAFFMKQDNVRQKVVAREQVRGVKEGQVDSKKENNNERKQLTTPGFSSKASERELRYSRRRAAL